MVQRARSAMSSLSNPGSRQMEQKLNEGAGWREAFDSGMYVQQKAKQDAMVVEQLQKMAETEMFTFDEQERDLAKGLADLESGLTRWQRAQLWADSLQGGTTAETVERRKEDLKLRLRIIGEFNQSERRMPRLLHRKAREAIALKLGVAVNSVEDVIFQFQLQYAQWSFLRREYLRGRPTPVTADELEQRLRAKPTREFVEVMNLFRRKKEQLEEARPSYAAPPRDMHINSKQQPLKIRPYISSSYRDPARRKPQSKVQLADKRHRNSRLL